MSDDSGFGLGVTRLAQQMADLSARIDRIEEAAQRPSSPRDEVLQSIVDLEHNWLQHLHILKQHRGSIEELETLTEKLQQQLQLQQHQLQQQEKQIQQLQKLVEQIQQLQRSGRVPSEDRPCGF